MKKLVGCILLLIFVLIIFLRKEQEGFSQAEWADIIDSIKNSPRWEELLVNSLTTMMAVQIEKLKELMKTESLEGKNLGGAKRVLFDDVKKSKREYTDQDYEFMNNLACNYPTLINKPLKDLLDYLTTRLDTLNKIKDEYKVDKDTTLKQLDDKIKENI